MINEKCLYCYLKNNVDWLCPWDNCQCCLHNFFQEFEFTFRNQWVIYFKEDCFKYVYTKNIRKNQIMNLITSIMKFLIKSFMNVRTLSKWSGFFYLRQEIYTFKSIFEKWLLYAFLNVQFFKIIYIFTPVFFFHFFHVLSGVFSSLVLKISLSD